MKKYTLLALVIFSLFSCSKKDTAPAVALTGTWKEDILLNATYTKDGLLINIDTLSATPSKATLYTDFKTDGVFEAYTLSGNNKAFLFNGSYSYDFSAGLFTQPWLQQYTSITYNIGRVRSNVINAQAPTWGYQYKVKLFNNKNLTIETQLSPVVYSAYDSPQQTTSTNYVVQTRMLTQL